MTRLTGLKKLGVLGLFVLGVIAVFGQWPAGAANPNDVQKLRATHACAGCDLSDTDLSGLIAEGSNLKGADFTNTKLYKARLGRADLTGATLAGADLSGADLFGAVGAADLRVAKTDAETRCPAGGQGPCQ